jgi:hypothetical protein
MLGLPDAAHHLEFTQYKNGVPCPLPTRDNLLVFYLPDREQRDKIAQKLVEMGYPEVEPENPYWKKQGITIEGPDKYRIVLMEVGDFNISPLDNITPTAP